MPSLIRNGYEYGTVPNRRGTIHTESGHVVNSVPRIRSGYESRKAAVKCPNFGRSGHSKGSCAYHVVCCSPIFLWSNILLLEVAGPRPTSFLYDVDLCILHIFVIENCPLCAWNPNFGQTY